MPTLYVLSGPDLGRSHEVEHGAVLGRGTDCQIVLHAPSISRRHAEVVFKDGRWFVQDLGSRNGVFGSDRRVTRLELIDGEVFRLGDLELRFRTQPPASTTSASPETRSTQAAPAREEAPEEAIEFEQDIVFDTPDADLVGGVEIELENEDALDTSPPPTATPTPRSATPPHTSTESRSTPEAQARRAAALERAGSRVPAGRGASANPAAGKVHDGSRPVLSYSREAEHSGMLSADLAQYPIWVRFLAGVLALGLFAGVFWLALKGTGFLKERAGGGGEVVEFEDSGE